MKVLQTKKRLALGFGIILFMGYCSPALAYKPTMLTPAWFKSVSQGLREDKDNVWRGTVIDVLGNQTLAIKTLDNRQVTVGLLHLASGKNASASTLRIQNDTLKQLVGRQVYVLGRSDKDYIYAKLLEGSGGDLNLELIADGVFDVDIPSLLYKKEKQQYENALRYAQRARIGIWTD